MVPEYSIGTGLNQTAPFRRLPTQTHDGMGGAAGGKNVKWEGGGPRTAAGAALEPAEEVGVNMSILYRVLGNQRLGALLSRPTVSRSSARASQPTTTLPPP